jgi:hypothetical protein
VKEGSQLMLEGTRKVAGSRRGVEVSLSSPAIEAGLTSVPERVPVFVTVNDMVAQGS